MDGGYLVYPLPFITAAVYALHVPASTCAIKSCFHAAAVRFLLHISDIRNSEQRRSYDQDCNMR